MTFILALLACTAGSGGEIQVGALSADVSLSDVIPTVPTVAWSRDQVERAWIEWGPDQDYGTRVAVDLSTAPRFETPLLGMQPDSDLHLRVVAETPDGVLATEDIALTTGSRSSGLPASTVDIADPEQVAPGYIVGTLVLSPASAVIIDKEGEIVWWYQPAGAEMLGRAALSRDGRSMLMASINLQADEPGELIIVSLDGASEERVSLPGMHHDFVELPDGTIAYIAFDIIEIDGRPHNGDRLMERAPDGTVTEIFSVWDHYELPPDEADDGVGGISWPHANAIDYLPADDDYLVSMLKMEGIARIDRASGQPEWVLGGAESTFTTAEGDVDFFGGQHQFDLLEDSILVFVNGGTGLSSTAPSRVVEVVLDPDRDLAETVWSYRPTPTLTSPILGDVSRLDSGNTLATFSYNGQIHELAPDDQVVWSLAMSIGGAVGFSTHVEALQDDGR